MYISDTDVYLPKVFLKILNPKSICLSASLLHIQIAPKYTAVSWAVHNLHFLKYSNQRASAVPK